MIALTLAAAPEASAQKKMYKHVDENGNVVYSDRPAKADQKAEKIKKANVESREATLQMQYQLDSKRQEEGAERAAQRRRAAGVAAREREDRRRRQELEREQYPEKGPREIRIVP